MKTPQRDELWFRYKDVGIKAFCRVGSGTISREITGAQGYDLFMDAPTKVCVVRHPWARLLSVWFGLWPGGTMPSRGYPAIKSLEQLMGHLTNTRDINLDPHCQSMYSQLEGYWLPEDYELITLDAFMANPPHGIPKPSQPPHQSPSYVEPEVDERLKLRFMMRYSADLALFRRAEKSPLVTGGNKATDGHEEE